MRYEALDSWRGICAIMVMLMHFEAASHVGELSVVKNSWLFVDFFFVLSGFVIAVNYKERLAQGFGILRFMILRFGRIWPLHVFILFVFVALELLLLASPGLQETVGRDAFCTDWTQPDCDGQHTADMIVPNILLIHSLPGVADNISWNGPSWSISVEFWTYLIFAIGIWIVSRLPKSEILLTIGLIGLVVACPLVIYFFTDNQTLFQMTTAGIIRGVYGFAAGVGAFMIWEKYREPLMAFMNKPGRATWVEAGLVALVVLFVGYFSSAWLSLFAPFVFFLVILGFAPQAGLIGRFLTRRTPVYFGALSYSIYMIHILIQMLVYWGHSILLKTTGVKLFSPVDHDAPVITIPEDANFWAGDVWLLVTAALVLYLSGLTYRHVERPCREWVRTRIKKRDTRLAAQPAPPGE